MQTQTPIFSTFCLHTQSHSTSSATSGEIQKVANKTHYSHGMFASPLSTRVADTVAQRNAHPAGRFSPKTSSAVAVAGDPKMHSFGYRANAVATFAVAILAVMCCMASFSDNFNAPSTVAEVKVLNINWFKKQQTGNDEVSLNLNISADLQSLFTWNTKQVFVFVAAEYETSQNVMNQVSLWDGIIQSKEHAKFWIHTTNKYRFIDQGSNLKGKDFNLTLHWHIMPKTGKMFADKIVMTGYRLPEEYR